MTKEQIVAILGGKALTRVHDDAYTFSTAPSAHPEFETYICFISPEKGLLKVVALSKDIETNSFGEAVKDRFEQVQAGLSKAYGQGNLYDYLKEGSIWNEPQDWMMGLLKDERTLEAFWQLNLPQDHITIIALKAVAISREKGYLSLGYEFEGWEQYVDSKKEKQDNVY
jgi:hypothetical protein